MIPARRPDQPFEDHQADMAQWLGHATVEQMNDVHDLFHAALCAFMGLESQSLREAAGEALTLEESTIAALEETAVLHCQRWVAHAKREGQT